MESTIIEVDEQYVMVEETDSGYHASELDEDVVVFELTLGTVKLLASAEFEVNADEAGNAYVAYYPEDAISDGGTNVEMESSLDPPYHTMYFSEMRLEER